MLEICFPTAFEPEEFGAGVLSQETALLGIQRSIAERRCQAAGGFRLRLSLWGPGWAEGEPGAAGCMGAGSARRGRLC